MSMRDYAVDDYGLLLSKDNLRILASKLCDDFTDDDWEEDMCGYIESVVDKLCIESVGDFSGEAMTIEDNGDSDWSDTTLYSGEPIYYIGAAIYPNLFKQAYNDVDELIEEFKEKVGEYLPKDFDYRNAVRHIVGTYFG